jgi:S-formylglutathione hydrolase
VYRSVSAFSPICNPVNCGWGEGCFSTYLGDKREDWEVYDATCLVRGGAKAPPILIDQGTADEFLAEQLFPQNLQAACEAAGLPLTLRLQEGYDHSYHFIASFLGEHLAWHAEALRSSA